MTKRSTWDVFCRVVDNYGDAGIALRLARQLVREHRVEATLWIDDVARLSCIAPGIGPSPDEQRHDGVRVRRLDDDSTSEPTLPDVVVEAFGCGLPNAYLDAMQAAPKPPAWIVLEYLSAERWVEASHGLPSPHPQRPLQRWFFFPGFSRRTGGLLRERDLIAQRDAFERGPDSDVLGVSLFCYPNAALPALLDAWAHDDGRVRCIVPEGVATIGIASFLGSDAPRAGERRSAGSLEIVCVAFVDQAAFDRRLWSSDLNIVRGEDSLVRALWAARPLCWHIYPQRERAHVAKLEAFLDRYAEGLDAQAASAVRSFWRAFNDEDAARTVGAWPAFRDRLPALRVHAGQFADRLAQLPDLAGELVAFARKRL